jgi:RHS repeat-associated protein
MVGFEYTSTNGTNLYYYLRNLQGDVIGIYDTNGNKVVEYVYDAWGNCTIKNTTTNYVVANANPIRYRGYYYDEDTKLYYLNARYYNPEWCRFISPDDTGYLDPETPNGLNLYAYCNNDPVNYADPSGHSAFLVAMSILAAAGLITTGIGLATDNNLVTAIGLTAISVPALISGGLAISLLTPVGLGVGITTTVAGAGTALFASAEYQEAFMHNNWMLDAGMSEEWYNGLMLTTATIATLGTMASSVAYSLNMNTITEVRRIKGVRAKDGYPGIRFNDKSGAIRSLEFHSAHQSHGVHLQLNNWWLNKQGYVGQYYRSFSKHFEFFKFWKGWF